MSKIAGANSIFFKIAGAKAPIAPVLNTPLCYIMAKLNQIIHRIYLIFIVLELTLMYLFFRDRSYAASR